MTDSPLQFTKRELQRLVREPLLWVTLAGISIVLGLVGPFGTYEVLALPGRVAYWSMIVVATYLTSLTFVCLLEKLVFQERPGAAGYAGLGAISGLPVAVVVWSINLAVFPGGAIGFMPLVLYAAAIAAIASGSVALFSERLEREDVADGRAASDKPPLLDRLPQHLRGRLLHLSVQDHYVVATTDKGSTLLLMRLRDAIAETGDTAGMQVHRSHWVTRDAVAASARRDGRLLLRLENGVEVPVSRRHLNNVKKAGLA